MDQLSNRLHYVLRTACAMCFIGHGIFGIITKPIWCNYFAVFGIGEHMAYQLMPWVGAFDISMGVLMIVYPMRIVAIWLIFWGLFTAMLRPLSGEFFAEVVERAGNYGAPLLLILFSSNRGYKNLFQKIEPAKNLPDVELKKLVRWSQVVACALLLGHGWLNLLGKAALLKQYTAIGFHDPDLVARAIGLSEIAAAVLILMKPFRQIVLILFVWKMGSELFYPSYELFEWIERGGSYGVLLALWLILRSNYRLSADYLSSTQPALELNGIN